jgi:hypothetical protein
LYAEPHHVMRGIWWWGAYNDAVLRPMPNSLASLYSDIIAN